MTVVEVEASGRIGPPSPHAKTTHKTHKYRKKEDNPQYVHMYICTGCGWEAVGILSDCLNFLLQSCKREAPRK